MNTYELKREELLKTLREMQQQCKKWIAAFDKEFWEDETYEVYISLEQLEYRIHYYHGHEIYEEKQNVV